MPLRAALARPAGVAWLCGLASLGVYLATGARTLAWANLGNDGPDLAAAVWAGGVPHPPGFPLYLLLAKAFTWLVPLPDLGWQLNVLSALGGSLAVGLVAAAGLRLTGSRLAAAGAALAYGFAALTWGQATIAEVSTWAAAAGAAALYLAVASADAVDSGRVVAGRRLALAACLATGLAAAIHPAAAAVAAPAAAWALLRRGSGCRLGTCAAAAGLAVAPLLLYATLPLRSGSGYLWQSLGSFREVWSYLTVQQYRGDLPGVATYGVALLAYLAQVSRSLAWVGLPLGAIGMWVLHGATQRRWVIPLATLGGMLPLLAHYGDTLIASYYAIALVPWAVGLAAGVAGLQQLDRRWAWLGVALPLFLLATNWRAVDVHRDRGVDAVAAAARQLPAGAVVFPVSYGADPLAPDGPTFALRYLLLRERADVAFVHQPNLAASFSLLPSRWPSYDWSSLNPASPAGGSYESAAASFVAANPNVPVYFSLASSKPEAGFLRLGSLELRPLPGGYLYQPVR